MNSLKVFSRLPKFCRFKELVSSQTNRTFSTEDLPHEAPKEKKAYEKTINNVSLLGRVGHDPLKKGTNEHPVVVFSMATHNSYKYENGEYQEKTDWHRISVFKPSLRDLVYTYLKKGQRVYVHGKITYGSITENGVIKNTTSIIADEVIFFFQNENET